MKPAPCSCLDNICLILLLYSASYIGKLKPPGIPAIYSTPCFSKSFTNISAPLYSFKKIPHHEEEEEKFYIKVVSLYLAIKVYINICR